MAGRQQAGSRARNASGNRSGSNNTRARRSTRGKGGLKQFLKSLTLSAVISFAAGSGLLYAQLSDREWPDSLIPDQLHAGWADTFAPARMYAAWPASFAPADLVAWGIGRFRQPEAPPALPVTGDHVQTRFGECPQFFPPGHMPVVPAAAGLRELCFSSFAILHSGHTKTPVFVAQKLTRQSVAAARDIDRNDRFYAEARLPEAERADLADYRGSGYARGHMAPAGDMPHKEAMAQSFSLANMVPQHPLQNSGAWNRIEQDTRKYVRRAAGDVYVFTGPVYGARPRVVGQGRVAVPDYIYKVVYDAKTRRSWVYWQANGPDAVAGPPITYAEFVRRTGLHLLPAARVDTNVS